MVVKNRGIRLKERLDPADQGQQKLLQVTYAQPLPASSESPPSRRPEAEHPMQAANPPRDRQASRRAIARMLRVELESTLAMLDQTLEKATASSRGLFGEQTKTD